MVETFKVREGELGNVDEMIARTKELKPDGIYLITYVNETAALLTKFAAAGIEAVMMGTSPYTPQLPALAGEAAENLVYPQPPSLVFSSRSVNTSRLLGSASWAFTIAQHIDSHSGVLPHGQVPPTSVISVFTRY